MLGTRLLELSLDRRSIEEQLGSGRNEPQRCSGESPEAILGSIFSRTHTLSTP
jgi:hypothetical protein